MRAIFILFLTVALLQAQSAIPSAEERMRRQSLNARDHVTLAQVKANKIDLAGDPFFFKLEIDTDHDVEQLEANRFEVWLEGITGVALAHIPRAGMEALGKKIQQGDVVIARIKQDEANLTLEILGVSRIGVWE